MNAISDTFPPLLIDGDDCERFLPMEIEICETAGSFISQGHPESGRLSQAFHGVVLANELLGAHTGESPEDECLHLCAEQLKCHFLSILHDLTDVAY